MIKIMLLSLALLTACASAEFATFWRPAGPVKYDANMVPFVEIDVSTSESQVTDQMVLLGSAVYNDTLFTTGWDSFTASPERPLLVSDPYLAWYVAGYAEGYLMMERINQTMTAQTITYTNDTAIFVNAQIEFVRQQAAANRATDPYWAQIAKQMVMLQGTVDGYLQRKQEVNFPYSYLFADAYRNQIFPEYTDIASAVAVQTNTTTDGATSFSFVRPPPPVNPKSEHCSALIKVTANDIFFAQSTWMEYLFFPGRVHKTYVMETALSMSGSAGRLHSGDDWYQTSNLLGIMETSNEFTNPALYLLIKPQTVPEFLRVLAASYLATSGKEWVTVFSKYASGTYCNQWMILDYKLYTKGSSPAALQDNLFWVAEEIPGQIASGDLTSYLRTDSYWASYNIPYFKSIYDLSFFNQEEQQYGTFFEWGGSPRAKIFRREQTRAVDLESMQKVLRYNDWQNDPLSTIPNCTGCVPATSPSCAIASRFDLVPANATFGNLSPDYASFFTFSYFGSLDGKITSYDQITNGLQASFQQGPTHDTQPAFAWQPGNPIGELPGMPQVFDFAWETVVPQQAIKMPSPQASNTYASVVVDVLRLPGPVQFDANGVPVMKLVVGQRGSFSPAANLVPLATAIYNSSGLSSGWDQLTVIGDQQLLSTDDASSYQAWYAAGVAEGYATHRAIYDVIVGRNFTTDTASNEWVQTHINYMRNNSLSKQTPFWKQVRRQLLQMDGMTDGYNMRTQANNDTSIPRVSFFDIFLQNFRDEYSDVQAAVAATPEERQAIIAARPPDFGAHCSGLIKIAANDYFVGQLTWAGFNIYIHKQHKTYVMDGTLTMSANAGRIISGDDWFQTPHGLVSLETTNEFMGNTLYSLIKPQCVSEFMRVLAANYLATTSQQWVQIYSTEPSGTYNNQWMVFDDKLYTPGMSASDLPDGTFWVAEEIPGLIQSQDMTWYLRENGYWASYNIPYFPEIAVISGFVAYAAQYGDYYSWESSNRAQIFRRDHNKVVDLDSMIFMMRYNDWQNDPLSAIPNCTGCNPATSAGCAISSRFDLIPSNQSFGNLNINMAYHFVPGVWGGSDLKISSSSLLRQGYNSAVVLGPTDVQQPSFTWNNHPLDISYGASGLVQTYSFATQYIQPAVVRAPYAPVQQFYIYDASNNFVNSTIITAPTLADVLPLLGTNVTAVYATSTYQGQTGLLSTVVTNNSAAQIGWDQVTVAANQALFAKNTSQADNSLANSQDYTAWYAAGVAEGYATIMSIKNNMGAMNYTYSPKAAIFVQTHIDYMWDNSLAKSGSDPFWRQVRKQLLQMEGISAGFNLRASLGGDATRFSFADIFRLNFNTEIGDIENAVASGIGRDLNAFPNHCSSLIKVAEDDVFMSHVTWAGYSYLIGRQYKTYMMETNLSMTSNAGIISSGDDFMISSTNIVAQETTLGFMNATLNTLIKPQVVSEFMRGMIASYLARTAQEWTIYFATEHSGTYCNQWQAFDFNLYKKGMNFADLPNGTFWMAEEVPDLIVTADMTWYLRENGFWPSYNIPYFPEIYQRSGFAQYAQEFGDFFSWENAPRHKIFVRDQPFIKDLGDMQRMMRYNNYQNDPYSIIPNCTTCTPKDSPLLAIASRGDLVSANFSIGSANASYADNFMQAWFGACDAKITTSELLSRFSTSAELGPTHVQQPILDWTPHQNVPLATMSGMLQVWNFSFVELTPLLTSAQPAPSDSGSDSKTAIIIGAAVGGSAVIVIALAIGFGFYRRSKNRESSELGNYEPIVGVQEGV